MRGRFTLLACSHRWGAWEPGDGYPESQTPLTSPPRIDLTLWRQRIEDRFGQRAIGIVVTLLLELLLIAVLFSLGMQPAQEEKRVFVPLTTFDVGEESAPAAAEEQEQPQADPNPADDAPEAVVVPAEAPRPSALPPLPSPVRTPAPPQPDVQPSAQPSAPPSPNRPRAVIRPGGGAIGPAGGTGRSEGDSDVVGTAPDGSPLFGARWFREPTEQEMRGYLSGIEPQSWALIACKTAPRWAVTDCVGLEQYPPNSNIMNGVLASTWQFQVRPPRRGGRSLVGSWVRIRISVTERRQSPS
jgi:protein TonB